MNALRLLVFGCCLVSTSALAHPSSEHRDHSLEDIHSGAPQVLGQVGGGVAGSVAGGAIGYALAPAFFSNDHTVTMDLGLAYTSTLSGIALGATSGVLLARSAQTRHHKRFVHGSLSAHGGNIAVGGTF